MLSAGYFLRRLQWCNLSPGQLGIVLDNDQSILTLSQMRAWRVQGDINRFDMKNDACWRAGIRSHTERTPLLSFHGDVPCMM